MFRLICKINNQDLDEIQVINTGHRNDEGEYLYRIKKPKKYNHLEIYHDRNLPWHHLAEKILYKLNKNGYNYNREKMYSDLIDLYEGFVDEKDA